MAIDIVEFPMKNGENLIFHSYGTVYQRVITNESKWEAKAFLIWSKSHLKLDTEFQPLSNFQDWLHRVKLFPTFWVQIHGRTWHPFKIPFPKDYE